MKGSSKAKLKAKAKSKSKKEGPYTKYKGKSIPLQAPRMLKAVHDPKGIWQKPDGDRVDQRDLEEHFQRNNQNVLGAARATASIVARHAW